MPEVENTINKTGENSGMENSERVVTRDLHGVWSNDEFSVCVSSHKTSCSHSQSCEMLIIFAKWLLTEF